MVLHLLALILLLFVVYLRLTERCDCSLVERLRKKTRKILSVHRLNTVMGTKTKVLIKLFSATDYLHY